MLQVDQTTAIKAQIEALSAKMKKLEVGKSTAKVMDCKGCGEAHEKWSYMMNEVETANFISNQNRNPGTYGNTYNPDYRKHPNFSWRDQNNAQQNSNFNQGSNSAPPQGNYQGDGSGKSRLEETITSLFNDLSTKHDDRFSQQEAELRL
jgi:hypothetical protein